MCGIVLKYTKNLLIGFNVIMFLLGITLLAVALSLRNNNHTKAVLDLVDASSTYYAGLDLAITVGALVMFIAILGCCGAYHESQWMLIVYSLCLLVVWGIAVAACFWGFSKSFRITSDLQRLYLHAYFKHIGVKERSTAGILTTLHSTLDCCGMGGMMEESISGTCPASGATRFAKSCRGAIDEFGSSSFAAVTGLLFGMTIVISISMMLSVYLWCAIQCEWERHERQDSRIWI